MSILVIRLDMNAMPRQPTMQEVMGLLSQAVNNANSSRLIFQGGKVVGISGYESHDKEVAAFRTIQNLGCIFHKQINPVEELEKRGYTFHGGELWKPPLGPRPEFPEEAD